jgi:phage tail sheath gpL-like
MMATCSSPAKAHAIEDLQIRRFETVVIPSEDEGIVKALRNAFTDAGQGLPNEWQLLLQKLH